VPSLAIKQSVLAEVRHLLVEGELDCAERPGSGADALTKHFTSLVKSFSAEFVWMIAKLVCSKPVWVPQHCAMRTGHRKQKAVLARPFGSMGLSVAVWPGIRELGFCCQDS